LLPHTYELLCGHFRLILETLNYPQNTPYKQNRQNSYKALTLRVDKI